jgi:hypothetical protein
MRSLVHVFAAGIALTTSIYDSRRAEARPYPADLGEASAHANILRERPRIDSDRTGDLTPKARAILERKDELDGQVITLRDVWPAIFAQGDAPPPSLRVWRRRLDGSATSCAGRVDVIPFEEYVKGVLPHEWIPSWDSKALEMGAVAIRTYAWWWVAAGGKYDCADLDDTTASQVYEDERLDKTNAAVDATSGVAIFKDGRWCSPNIRRRTATRPTSAWSMATAPARRSSATAAGPASGARSGGPSTRGATTCGCPPTTTRAPRRSRPARCRKTSAGSTERRSS